MKYTPDGYGERCRFDAFCKTVLRNEARTHLRDLGRQRNREIEFSALSQQELNKLCTVDEYPSDSILFTVYGYTLHIRDELVAAAFASLPEQGQGILILHCVLELADGEIGNHVVLQVGVNAVQNTPRVIDLRQSESIAVIPFCDCSGILFQGEGLQNLLHFRLGKSEILGELVLCDGVSFQVVQACENAISGYPQTACQNCKFQRGVGF